jgi:fumarate hydratase subunit alpha
MKRIDFNKIVKTVSELCIEANVVLRRDCFRALKDALRRENNKGAHKLLEAIIENAKIAKEKRIPICQDTGIPVVFIDIGEEVKIIGGNLKEAINRGIELGYRKGFLRPSIIKDPILREGGSGYRPAVIHFSLVKGDRLRLSVLPKGFGCENKSQVKMFKPTETLETIKNWIVEVIRQAGPDACPPFVVGVGIGGTADYAMYLAKKALLKEVISYKLQVTNYISKVEQDLLKKINKLNIGPMGLGGKTTCLGINILTYPTHIAGLPVAVNISCHALRSATRFV